ncbi:protein kintoun-like [Eucyclogobius newberryi]|uniref:protein kintoun-like n=1 Tax=Eucyclogobius newberryi TaxID=166745 RepID=UPI003B59E550
MQHEAKLPELNVTEEEMGRFTKAFKDENFRTMLRDYAEEISDPENRKRYEEEIAILEKERGNSVQFIHPTPFKCIRTSVNGQNKCYVNVCASDKIGQASCKRGLSDDGQSGHHWSLPHSLPPERKELDPKGNKILIYDVIFHPDTLHMASANSRFMDMVTTVAIQSIQDGFNVCLDKTNIKTMSTKYKGNASLQACVIRKPIPGFKAKDASDDPLAFPYPDYKATMPQKDQKNGSQSHSKHLANTQTSTKPHYTLKYRSFIDLQDFRCTRVSTRSPRPKEIILTIDLPLLESVAAITLEVEEKSLLLESQNPVYKLELPLAFAVDEEKGAAKFNRQSRQLVVTLPVRPPPESLHINNCPQGSADDDMHDPDGVCESGGEVEPEDHSEARAAEPQEHTAAEETGDTCEEEEDLRLCEEHQDGTTAEEHARVTDETDQKEQVTIQEVQACVEKKVEREAIQELQEEKESETELESKAPIRDDFIETEKASEDLPGAPESVRAAEEMNEDLLKSERDISNSSDPPVLLTEVREDGSLRALSDHVTTAGFSFHNSLLFELD